MSCNILMIEDAVSSKMMRCFLKRRLKASFYHDGKEGLDAFCENQTNGVLSS